ncbi:flagellar basal body P-ring protein FlgI [Marinobacterium sp. D7]|uniref:flagellar basal body P-ring protein FlgI n=1 Tax=Marinobacterium ramblicola TaxID=2849041 RepID=UPI001C2DCEA0|nr:flagellar basal body P-ring protein FlgI [Marinobacterium ramblicola]MBV1787729.1 flagellar basal body P-ring protein FlgI [Marinobacterium ramblicola]
MVNKVLVHLLCFIFVLSFEASANTKGSVRLKDLARLASVKDSALVGYGIVTGLAGTGDSTRNSATLQSVHNMLLRFGLNVPTDQVRSRNAAAVMVTATLPAYSQSGDKLDVNVTSIGDARSLVGGTLLLTPMAMSDRDIYAMAQGPLSVGGFSYDLNGNVVQKNHPTAAHIPDGATVDRSVNTAIVNGDGKVVYKLHRPDFETASRIVDSLSRVIGAGNAKALDAARIEIRVPGNKPTELVSFLTQIERIEVVPDSHLMVVVNERTGTVVSGAEVVISPVTVAHGNLNVAISTEYQVSQPFGVGNVIIDSDFAGVRTEVVPKTSINVEEQQTVSVSLPQGSKVSDLVTALNKVHASSRDIITILQGIKRAGALHAELIIQ